MILPMGYESDLTTVTESWLQGETSWCHYVLSIESLIEKDWYKDRLLKAETEIERRFLLS
jgi:hypothetical protein